MPLIQQILFYCIAVVIFVLILELVRRRHLKEYYSVLWLATSVMLFFFIYHYNLLVRISAVLQVTPSILLLFMGAVFLLLLVLQLSIVVSKQSVQIKKLVQRLALLEDREHKPTDLFQ